MRNALPHFEKQDVAAVGAKPDVPKNDSTWVERTWACMKWIPNLCSVSWLSSCNFIVRKSAFDAVNGFDGTLTSCEDADIGFRLSRKWRLVNDPDVRVIHLREPKTIIEFFNKERWHGAENYRGMFRHGLALKEIPSLVLPLVTAVGFLGMGYGIFTASWFVVSFSAGVLLLPTLLQTMKVMARKRNFSNIGSVFCLFFVYSLARFASLVKQ